MDAAVFVRDATRGWLTLTGDGMEGWLSLGERAEEIALGRSGRFWRPDIEWYDVSTMTPERFAAFDEPGWGADRRELLAPAVRHLPDHGLLRDTNGDRESGGGPPVRGY